MDKMDRRRQRSRQMITEALLDLLMEKKFNTITIQEITDRANVGRATFYLHYRNKEECLVQMLTGGFDALVTEIDQMAGKNGRDFVDTLEKVFQYTSKNRKLYFALLNDNPKANIMGDVQAYIREKMIRAIPIPPGIHAVLHEAISVNLTGSLIAMVLWLLKEDPPLTPRQAARMFVTSSMYGISSMRTFNLNEESTAKGAV